MVPASFFFSSIADYTGLHRTILLVALLVSTSLRVLIYFGNSFVYFLLMAMLTQVFSAPVTVLTDTIMMSNVRKEGEYGKIRAWGALGWGGFSAAAGPMIDALGFLSGFIASAVCNAHVVTTMPRHRPPQALTLPCAPATRAFKFTGAFTNMFDHHDLYQGHR